MLPLVVGKQRNLAMRKIIGGLFAREASYLKSNRFKSCKTISEHQAGGGKHSASW